MKKLISLALALVLSLSLIACGAKQDDTPQTGADTPDTTQTAEKQKLIVGFDAEFPPFGFIAADGSYDGFDLAMAEELCSRLGWQGRRARRRHHQLHLERLHLHRPRE